jgi:hypothetical protein
MQEFPDDPTIKDDEILYRRIPNASFMVIDELTQVRRPTSAVFNPDKDGGTVADVRAEGLGVALDAWPEKTDDPAHLRNAAHALVIGFRSLSKGQRKLKQRALIKKCKILIYPPQP